MTCYKRVYDKKTALTQKNYLMRLGKEKYLRTYQCPNCGYWHLTKRMIEPKKKLWKL